MATQCFLVKPTLNCFLWLRRYSDKSKRPGMPGEHSYHQNWTPIGVMENGYKLVHGDGLSEDARLVESSEDRTYLAHNFEEIGHEDPRWPRKCEKCDYEFTENDLNWQNFTSRMYVAGDGRSWPQRELPAGAMYFEDWLPRNFYWDNKRDPHLIVILPNGIEWNVDSRANNCTMPNDRTHRCWSRTGEAPKVTAGKQQPTCAAGAGSILAGSYHGFLQNGELT